MSDDDRKWSYSERDRRRREGGRPPSVSGRARAERARETRRSLEAADALFGGEKGGDEGKHLAAAVRAAHGSAGHRDACRAYYDVLGAPDDLELASIFLDAGEKDLSLAVLDVLLREKERGRIELQGGLRRQIRLLAEDFDDDLASRAEELIE